MISMKFDNIRMYAIMWCLLFQFFGVLLRLLAGNQDFMDREIIGVVS